MQLNQGAGAYGAKDDLLHPEAKQAEPGETMSETQYFGLCMPEEGIHGTMNLWCHPNLGCVNAGVWVFQGFKKHHLASEIFDFRMHMSDSVFVNDLNDYTLINGFGVRIIEAGKKFHAHYKDEQRNNSFDIEYTAVMPPFMFSSNKHFEQTMKAEGELVLRGKKYQVHGYTVRDRSWGNLRSEANQALPPMSWMSGVFNDDFSFCCCLFDDPDDHPEWQGRLVAPEGRLFSGGYIRNNGETLPLIGGRKRVIRNLETLFPERVELELVDSRDNRYQVAGTIVAASSFSWWYNTAVALCQCRWKYNGMIGYGDVQDQKWGDFMYLHMNR